jgi:serine/threonine protein phosphatase PrpC
LAPPNPIALLLDVLAAGETDRGCKRASNEDTLLVRADLGLYIVADGAGGHSAGNVASAIATSEVAKRFDASEAASEGVPEVDAFGLWSAARRLSAAVHEANKAVIEIARSSNKYRGMGTTIVCALVVPETGRIHVAHVGDSRCYRMRNAALELLTPDHSILNDVVELYPELDDAALSRLPRKAVTRALGMEERVRVGVRTFQALAGDRYLLCSDGITGELGEAVLANLLGQSASAGDVVRELVRAAKDVGGRDNVTALVVDCRAASPGAVRPRPPPRTVPTPVPSKPRTAPPPDPQVELNGPTELSDPEIVLFRTEGTKRDHSEPMISVVPVNTADAQMIRALDRVAGTLGGEEISCVRCGVKMDAGTLACPRCGYSDNEVLSRR